MFAPNFKASAHPLMPTVQMSSDCPSFSSFYLVSKLFNLLKLLDKPPKPMKSPTPEGLAWITHPNSTA